MKFSVNVEGDKTSEAAQQGYSNTYYSWWAEKTVIVIEASDKQEAREIGTRIGKVTEVFTNNR